MVFSVFFGKASKQQLEALGGVDGSKSDSLAARKTPTQLSKMALVKEAFLADHVVPRDLNMPRATRP